MLTLQRMVSTQAFRYALALIWVINGLFCKVLGLVPRHEQIVSVILGAEHAHVLTVCIGLAEVAMAIWILSGWRYRLCATLQITVIAGMNIIEFLSVPELLLWGRANAIFAIMLILLIHQSAFGPSVAPKKIPHHVQ